jgi:hypothetical protein
MRYTAMQTSLSTARLNLKLRDDGRSRPSAHLPRATGPKLVVVSRCPAHLAATHVLELQ